MIASRVLQFEDRPGILDLGWGHPARSSIPAGPWRAAHDESLRTFGWQQLSYGYAAGPDPLREWISAHLNRVDAGAAQASEIFVTGGASHALDLVCRVLTRPGDLVLVDSATYHLALRIISDHGVQVVGVPADQGYLDPDALVHLAASARRAGARIAMLYLVPTFNNPTGRSLPPDRRHALIEAAQRQGIMIVEDDTYRELSYAGPAPDSLRSQSGGASVIRLGSFAKTVAPGIRLGFIQAGPDFISTLSTLGYIHSGGGVNHATALTLATFACSGAYADHVAGLRTMYAGQRDALVDALRAATPLQVQSPDGGWFLWLRLPPEMPADTLLEAAESAGVSFLTGAQFSVNGDTRDHVRLAFSMLTPPELREAATRLGSAIQSLNARSPGP